METKASFVVPRVAKQFLNVNDVTLRRWADSGVIHSIRTPTGMRLYNVDDYIKKRETGSQSESKDELLNVCYCRVSSSGQKDDLQRQIAYMQERFPTHRIIQDIGSGINFKRKGLQTLLELAMSGKLKQVVVSYRDRLCRFAFELLEWIFSSHNVQLVVLNSKMDSSEHSELTEDLLAIINVFNCRINGKRKYSKKSDKSEQSEEVESCETEITF
jgi:predicted site-specific integrase-resolvase